MAKSKEPFDLEAEQEYGETPEPRDPDPGPVIPIPAGADEAIFTQGTQEGAQDMRNGATV